MESSLVGQSVLSNTTLNALTTSLLTAAALFRIASKKQVMKSILFGVTQIAH